MRVSASPPLCLRAVYAGSLPLARLAFPCRASAVRPRARRGVRVSPCGFHNGARVGVLAGSCERVGGW